MATNGERLAVWSAAHAAKKAKKAAATSVGSGGLSDAAFLDAAIKAGKFSLSRRAHYAKLMSANGPATRGLIDALQAFPGLEAVPTSIRASTAPAALSATPSRFGTKISMGDEVLDVPLPSTPRPTLFADGDLPPVTASGIDPSLLNRVAWQARQALARASTHSEASVLLERYGGPDGQTQAEVDALSGGPLAVDVADYEARQSRWASGYDQ